MGQAYNANNQAEKAKEYLTKALQINPSFKGAEEARKVLTEINTSRASN